MSSLRRRLLFFRDGFWRKEADNAELRIESSLELAPKVRNEISRKTVTGWEPISEEPASVTAIEQGLCFTVSPALRGARNLLAFESVRFVDEQMLAGPLRGLHLLNEDGQEFENPLLSGTRFLLSAEEGKLLASNVKLAGGTLSRADTPLDSAAKEFSQLESELKTLSESLSYDLDFLDAVSNGDFTGQLEFDERGRNLRNACADLNERLLEAEQQMSRNVEAEMDSKHRAELLKLVDKLGAFRESLKELRQARSRAEHLLARQLAGSSPSITMPPIARQLLVRDLAQLAQEQDLPCYDGEGGVVIELPEAKLIVDETGLRLDL